MIKEKITFLLTVIALVLTFFAGMYISFSYMKSLRKEREYIQETQTEIHILKSELGRYEMAVEYLKEEDSVAAKKLQDYLNNQTE